jgi:imidazolonepropionase
VASKTIAMAILIKNIKKLIQTEDSPREWVAGADMANLSNIDNAFLLINDGVIQDFGPMENIPAVGSNFKVIDAEGRMVFPSFCDSHTHLVYAGSREIEYVDKIRGLSYEEIAKFGQIAAQYLRG